MPRLLPAALTLARQWAPSITLRSACLPTLVSASLLTSRLTQPARYRSTSTKPSRVPIEPPAEIDNEGAAGLFDEVALDGEEWEGEEIQEGVFVSVPTPASESSRPKRPQTTSIKHLNRLLSRHQVPDIPEDELEERFVRGRGPGGQAINKTNSSVSLIHLPTGIRVQSQPTRSRAQNRIIARQILKERLDLMRARGELHIAAEEPSKSSSNGKQETSASAAETPELAAVSRKERLAAEARMWSKQELRWEKERRRKANRVKKVKRRKNTDEEAGAEEDDK